VLLSTHVNAPPNFLKDSNASLKMKTTKEEVGVHSLTHNTSRVRGVCWGSEMKIRTSDK
jgi:hypothetical protein